MISSNNKFGIFSVSLLTLSSWRHGLSSRVRLFVERYVQTGHPRGVQRRGGQRMLFFGDVLRRLFKKFDLRRRRYLLGLVSFFSHFYFVIYHYVHTWPRVFSALTTAAGGKTTTTSQKPATQGTPKTPPPDQPTLQTLPTPGNNCFFFTQLRCF